MWFKISIDSSRWFQTENQISHKISCHHYSIWRKRSFVSLYLRIQTNKPDFSRWQSNCPTVIHGTYTKKLNTLLKSLSYRPLISKATTTVEW